MNRSASIFLVLVAVFLLLTPVWAQKRDLVFGKGDMLFYLMSGFNKVPDLTVWGLGNERTDIPPIGWGMQISVFENFSLGPEFITTYINKTTSRGFINGNSDYRRIYLILLFKAFYHYPLSFFDPYIGGGGGYHWVRNEVSVVNDTGGLYWMGTAGFRLSFGKGNPVGIFLECSVPYPLIAGGLYFRFQVF